jgi:hypothetical protein
VTLVFLTLVNGGLPVSDQAEVHIRIYNKYSMTLWSRALGAAGRWVIVEEVSRSLFEGVADFGKDQNLAGGREMSGGRLEHQYQNIGREAQKRGTYDR